MNALGGALAGHITIMSRLWHMTPLPLTSSIIRYCKRYACIWVMSSHARSVHSSNETNRAHHAGLNQTEGNYLLEATPPQQLLQHQICRIVTCLPLPGMVHCPALIMWQRLGTMSLNCGMTCCLLHGCVVYRWGRHIAAQGPWGQSRTCLQSCCAWAGCQRQQMCMPSAS
jgi:hypothetical protein